VKDMDHATQHAISELASQLGQPLREELKLTFSELVEHVEWFRKSLHEISSSMSASQGNLEIAADELLPKMEAAKRDLETSIKSFSDSVESLKGDFLNNLDIRVTAIVNNSEKIVGSLSGELSHVSNDLNMVEKVLEMTSNNLTETSQKLDSSTAGLRKEIDNWNGILRATSHAHSKELEALSTLVSELIINMKTRILEEIDEQINARDNRVRQDMAENNIILAQLFKRIVRIERFIWAAVCIIVLLAFLIHTLL
jgi:RNA processing factor Prp31